ncbi:hypothetical protein AMEX_G24925 [Astyanax mexicanus]|uniref:1-alkyl-2-acetylglycerophosphocholine esterase n=1 Tax=Astyanax mexicanus TaxID=7994 RepID=A0A8T2KWI8_ASTMX|nr:hypothetical protein AMEX_G24925 [Astyanax mexicanus]
MRDLVVSTFGKKEFAVRKGLNVCFLTDSMCRGIDQHFTNAYCWVHPGTTLVRSAHQHLHHLKRISGDTLVIIHIGTNDVASGVSADTILQRMADMVDRISSFFKDKLYFAVSAVLPRFVDDKKTKHTVKRCNILLERWCGERENMVFLQTWKAFVFRRDIRAGLFSADGLHLNRQGKLRLFDYFKHFLWNFCQFIVYVPSTKNKVIC